MDFWDGLIEQWGKVSSTSTIFPITYSTSSFDFQIIPTGMTDTESRFGGAWNGYNITTSGFNSYYNSAYTVYWSTRGY